MMIFADRDPMAGKIVTSSLVSLCELYEMTRDETIALTEISKEV